jgi:hypothetical protein
VGDEHPAASTARQTRARATGRNVMPAGVQGWGRFLGPTSQQIPGKNVTAVFPLEHTFVNGLRLRSQTVRR